MKILYFRRRFNARHRGNERGQTAIILVIALSLFMLAFTGLAVDYSNLWFHRQAAQGAADAACQAAAMDMYVLSQGTPVGGTFNPGFTPTSGASNDCSSNASATPCKYAALNGYDGKGLATGSNSVVFSFPDSVPGVTAPAKALTKFPFMKAEVTDRTRGYLSAVLTGSRTQDVQATAKCGLVVAKSPIPIIVLHPTKNGALSSNGAKATIAIHGGPQRSIQVNSNSKTAVSTGGTIDLSKGGPSGTGSDLGTWGGGYPNG